MDHKDEASHAVMMGDAVPGWYRSGRRFVAPVLSAISTIAFVRSPAAPWWVVVFTAAITVWLAWSAWKTPPSFPYA